MIEAQQLVIDESGEDRMAYTHFDNGLTLGRRLIDARIAEETKLAEGASAPEAATA